MYMTFLKLSLGIPGRKRGTPGNPGYFKMQFLHLRNGLCDKVVLPQGFSSSSRKYRFSINNRKMHVNLDEGLWSFIFLMSPFELNKGVL